MSRTAPQLIGVGALALSCGQCGGAESKFQRELAALGLPAEPGPTKALAEADIAAFPEPARRYLTFMGALERPRDWSFRAALTGRFRTKPGQAWMPMNAWQYNSSLELTRVFYIRVRFFGVMPVLARDTYVRGQGRMLIRPLDLFTAEDARGPEVAISELATYLNDAIMLGAVVVIGPGLFLDGRRRSIVRRGLDPWRPHRAWRASSLDAQGAPRDFSTTDRFLEEPLRLPPHPSRSPGALDHADRRMAAGRRQAAATSGRAVWHLPQGDFTYVEVAFSPERVAFNVPPGTSPPGASPPTAQAFRRFAGQAQPLRPWAPGGRLRFGAAPGR